jgi:hypothetical protein
MDAITRNVGRKGVSFFAGHEAELVPLLEDLSAAETAAAMRSWRARFDAVDDREPRGAAAGLSLSMVLDGSWRVDGELDTLTGQLLDTALQAADTRDGDGEPDRTHKQRRADALGVICGFFLDNHTDTTAVPAPSRPHLNVIVTLEDLERGGGGRFVNGGNVEGPATQALLCDSALHG